MATISDIRPGCVVEVVFKLNDQIPPKTIQIDFNCNGVDLADKAIVLTDLNADQQVRLVYKLPIIQDDVTLRISSLSDTIIHNLQVFKHQDQAINLTKDIMTGKRHQGGVTFDCLPQ